MNFNVNPEQLRKHGGAIEDTGAGSVGELDALHGQTTAGGTAVWGTDGTCDQLAGLYQELTSLTGEALGLVTAVMQDSGTNLRQMGDAYEQTDDHARGEFQRLEGELA